ncbi:hypothetical protein [Psychroflexus sp. ALD_RP9]|uniref:hypothetical protein n=1 Tax=Psychroflexus sp. ALD_RP9 TaxID=2777186 RepID=UPI001A9076D0|nr:hypothetical protein [Psychroflexus sp. ALD_RP9]QSS98017.1 hypothetical protein IMZ30_04700 [Psychroflexus sp. ALD_RP9]
MPKSTTTYRLRLIYPLDLAEFKSCGMSTAYTEFKKIKQWLGKDAHQVVTNEEAALYYGIELTDFESIINCA